MDQSPPFLDSRVKYISASKIHTLNKRTMKELKEPLFVIVEGEVVLVIAPISTYLAMQKLAAENLMNFYGLATDA